MLQKWLLLIFTAAVITTPLLALDDQLETDCNQPSATDDKTAASTPQTESPYRLDNITREECRSYAAMRRDTGNMWRSMSCTPDMPGNCDGNFGENFLLLTCRGSGLDRPEMIEVATNISRISPRRPVAIHFERVETFSGPTPDILKSDVIEPFRNQVIEIKMRGCTGYTDRITGNVYEVGMLPNLYRFGIFHCMGLKLQKKDFSRMPQVKMIYIELSSIEDMEPYTFTDLKHLQLLVLESGAYTGIGQVETYRAIGRPDRAPLQDSDVERVRKLHCDCKYAWFRNFLRKNPSLIASKQPGEVYAVGAYKSPWIFIQGASSPDVLSVDCARPLVKDNIRPKNGSQYSYNTQCYNLKC
ncbi:uncharacterized protein LOC129594653 [Paramacrobiotus metropolitanus]|uniref:uncharacterized protein LOC129594653 n=1 Tax=Paramacrobiotus metropolitanus TaxID=2943436 RepID=UPI0024458905|nr:uncharacterized protein LOC129594653 [Paramacrobiotus metropolitanus]